MTKPDSIASRCRSWNPVGGPLGRLDGPPPPRSGRGRRSPWTWRRLLAAVLLPLLLAGGAPLGAQPAGGGPKIESIEFRGLATLSEETLRYYLGIEPGEALDEAALDRNIKQLWDRRLIDDIQIESEPTPSGVKLIVTLVERPVLRSIDYQGLKRISKNDVVDKVSSNRIQVREGEPLSLGELQRVKTLIEELYKEKGYRFANARYVIEDVGPNEKKVTFTVDEGNRVRISDIAFEGNTVFNDLRLRLAMKKTKESGPISRFTKKDIYNPATLQEDLGKVRDLYRAAGYKNAVIGEPKVEVRAAKPDLPPAQQKRRMYIIVPVEEGERWKFGEVTIEGNEVYSDQALLRVFRHKEDSWLRAKVVDDGVKAITDLYHNSGYIFARVDPELVERPNGVADVVVHVDESDQYRVGRVEFQGNGRTMDKVLRREIRVQEGSVVSIGAVRNTVTKVNQLGYFKLNEEDPVDIDYDSEHKKVNLVFKGAEAERTELQFGGGWSEIDGFFGQFAVNTKNFLGRGEQVGFSFQTGGQRQLFDLSYFVPWFLDKPQSVGVRLYDQDVDFRLLTDQRLLRNSRGAVLTYGRNYRLFQQLSFSYNRSQYEDERTFIDTMGQQVVQRLDIDNSSFRPYWAFDSRDNPFDTKRGRRINLGVEYAGGALGGDNNFLRPEAGFTLFQPLTELPVKTILGLNLEAGYIHALKPGGVSFLDLYFLGGENSVRGHRYRSIFVRNEDGTPAFDEQGFAVGGDRFVQANFEYQFLLGGPFRLMAFADAGNVYDRDQGWDVSNLRYTAGAELRVLLPVFGAPLRFIYAYNLNPKPNDRFESFQFSIGTSF